MTNNYHHRCIAASFSCIFYVIIGLLLACTQKEEILQGDAQSILIPIEISGISAAEIRAIGDPNHTVDRILILPFKKVNEAGGNVADNFSPDFSNAIQLDVNSFSYSGMLHLPEGSTYQVLIIGYNRNDYNLATPEAATRRFSISSTGTPELLSNIQLEPIAATDVPEFFIATCSSHNGANFVGEYFKPENTTGLSGNLTRIVSGLDLTVTNIPAFVSSVTLAAEKLVKAITINDISPSLWQIPGDTDNKILDTQDPVNGTVTFSKFLLPTYSTYNTKLYLDITYGSYTSRYEVKVADLINVATANSITFSPNQVVRITGDYGQIDIGFQIDYLINLEDNEWDGLE